MQEGICLEQEETKWNFSRTRLRVKIPDAIAHESH